jgi:hypothetical protein
LLITASPLVAGARALTESIVPTEWHSVSNKSTRWHIGLEDQAQALAALPAPFRISRP